MTRSAARGRSYAAIFRLRRRGGLMKKISEKTGENKHRRPRTIAIRFIRHAFSLLTVARAAGLKIDVTPGMRSAVIHLTK